MGGPTVPLLAPFCAPDIVWDFRIPRVKSISTSGHKFGLAPLGVGWVLWRRKEICTVTRPNGAPVTLGSGFGVVFEWVSLEARIEIARRVALLAS